MDPRTLLGGLGIPGDGAREAGGLATSLGAAIPVAGLAGAPAAKAAPALELDLIARARGGDQDAFAVLVRLHQRAVYALAMRMLRDEDEATEATQEAFLAAWQGLAGFRAEARFATWVYRITYNYCLKVAERRRRDALARAELTSQTERAERPAVPPQPGTCAGRPARPVRHRARGDGQPAAQVPRGARAAPFARPNLRRDGRCPRDADRDGQDPPLPSARAPAGPAGRPRPRHVERRVEWHDPRGRAARV